MDSVKCESTQDVDYATTKIMLILVTDPSLNIHIKQDTTTKNVGLKLKLLGNYFPMNMNIWHSGNRSGCSKSEVD